MYTTFALVFTGVVLLIMGAFLLFVAVVAAYGLYTFGGTRREWLLPLVFAWGGIILCYSGTDILPFTVKVETYALTTPDNKTGEGE